MPHADPIIVALTGRAGVGKDTAAEWLCQRHGFVAVSFAAGLYEMLEALFSHANVDHARLYERQLKELPIPELGGLTPRQLLQTLGTEWGRRLSDDLWVRVLARQLGMGVGQGAPVHDRIVITDTRFANEAAWVRLQRGQIWRITRHAAAPVREHASEQQDDVVPDLTIRNDGSLGWLQLQLDNACERLDLRPLFLEA